MRIIHTLTTSAVVLGIAALGCNAASARPVADPAAPPAASGSPADAAEPSAATPGTAGEQGIHAGISRKDTQQFVDAAVYANLAEVAAGRYALAHSQSPEVKQFAQQMIHDHTQANDRLTTIALSRGLRTPLGISPTDRTQMRRLEQQHGSRFNAAYSRAQDSDHREAVALFKRAEQNPRIDPAVRDFARQTLPVLEDHLRMANQLVATESGGNRSAG